MPRDIVDADAIMPGRRGWTCVVQVIERHPVLLKGLPTHPFQRRFRPYLLTDMKGTKVRAILFDRDIDFFERSLLPFRRYKISNATVTLPPERYQLPGYRYSWIINNTCPVEPIADPEPHVLPCTFDVCRFSTLCNFAESDTTVDIKGLVVHRFPFIDINETRSAKDYLIVNEEEIPIVLRLWKDLLADYDPDVNSFDKDPVTIIASNLEVNTFHEMEDENVQVTSGSTATSARTRSKHMWTDEQDKMLVEAMVELFHAGTHRAESGFKAGFLNVLEEKLGARIPGITVINIRSRLKTLRKDLSL